MSEADVERSLEGGRVCVSKGSEDKVVGVERGFREHRILPGLSSQ